MAKKNKKKKDNQRTKVAKWTAIAAWAVPAYPIAQTIRDVVNHFLLKK